MQEEYGHALSMVAEFSNDAIVVATARRPGEAGWPITYVNPAFERMTGYLASEVRGRSLRFLQGPLTDKEILGRIRANLEAGKSSRETVLNYRKDGAAFWAELDINPVTDASGAVTHWISIQRDVTERFENEVRFSRVSQKTAGMLYTYRLFPDGHSCFPYAAGAVERLYGVMPEAIALTLVR